MLSQEDTIGLAQAVTVSLASATAATEELRRAQAHPLAFFYALERGADRFHRAIEDRQPASLMTPAAMESSVLLTYASALTMAAAAVALLATLPKPDGYLNLAPHILIRFSGAPATDAELVEAAKEAGKRRPPPGSAEGA